MIKKRICKSLFGIFIGRNAYKVACLGVTEGDWRALAMEALEVRFIVGVQIRVRELWWENLGGENCVAN